MILASVDALSDILFEDKKKYMKTFICSNILLALVNCRMYFSIMSHIDAENEELHQLWNWRLGNDTFYSNYMRWGMNLEEGYYLYPNNFGFTHLSPFGDPISQ